VDLNKLDPEIVRRNIITIEAKRTAKCNRKCHKVDASHMYRDP
jgi:hypothetical protein